LFSSRAWPTQRIAVDYGSQGIRANAIQPAGIQDSNLSKHAGEDRERQTTPQAKLPRPRPRLPILKAGHPRDEYGATVAFLLSDDAGYITGAAIPVDGGYLAT
jgi:NAD(P)-dependent dehydrogenase (short-subunit alcohol dehydrogenase family)